MWQVPSGSHPYTSDLSKWRSKKDDTALPKALTVEESLRPEEKAILEG